jgi:hypothetical protein
MAGIPINRRSFQAHTHDACDASGAHRAHLAVVALHILCCGLPVLAAFAGVGIGASVIGAQVTSLHGFVHLHEVKILALSAALVLVGGVLEARNRNRTRFPVLFAISAACFLVNAALITAHQTNPTETVAHTHGTAAH